MYLKSSNYNYVNQKFYKYRYRLFRNLLWVKPWFLKNEYDAFQKLHEMFDHCTKNIIQVA